ncbi:MAG: DMT family transporter [Bryobacteraceae bacterium]|nr:DMT family transporter [Bryobacteraceae bacterium]
MPARLAILAAAFLFSTGGAVIKAAQLNAWQLASYRSLVAGAVLLALLPAARQGWTWRMVPVGVAYALTLVSFVLATKLTTSANAIFLQATAPLYLLFIAPWWLGERWRPRDLLGPMAIAMGMTLFFVGREPTVLTAPNPWLGNLCGAASGFTWALTVAGLRWLNRGGIVAGNATAAMGNLLAGLFAFAPALPIPAFTGADVAVLLYLGVFQIGLSYYLLNRGLARVPAFEASVLILLEPALNPVWTYLFHGEQPSTLAMIGGGIIGAATLLQSWLSARE